MPTPTPYAIGAEWQTNGSADFLHLKDKGGTIIGWIDKDGFLQGTLASGGGSLELEINGTPNVDQSLLNLIAGSNITLSDDGLGGITIASSGGGNGFASGTTVANSTGNTPADGFTLSNGSGDTNTQSPSDINLGSTGNPGVIDLNSEGSPTVTIGNGATVGTSTILSRLTPSSIGITGGSPTITITDTAGDVAELQTTQFTITNVNGTLISAVTNSTDATIGTTDSSGNVAELGSPNGASLTLTGTGGTSITLDGTVPSTIWDDGAGNETILGAGAAGMVFSAADGNAITIADSTININSSGPTAISMSISSGEPTISFSGGTSGTLVLQGPDVAGANIVTLPATTGEIMVNTGTQTTVGAAGGASPLPLTPTGYALMDIGGTIFAMPFYAAS